MIIDYEIIRTRNIEVSNETMEILENSYYINQKGEKINIKDLVDNSVKNTELIDKDKVYDASSLKKIYDTEIKISSLSTIDTIIELYNNGEGSNITTLNFASGKYPGGGFLSGSTAQEESLVRATTLYASINSQKKLYEYNRNKGSAFYSDYMIYSPCVAVIRRNDYSFLEKPLLASFITAPAVNARAARQRGADEGEITNVMDKRINKILALAAEKNTEILILGAYGCGVFENDPKMVSKLFSYHINNTYRNVFKKIIFPIMDKKKDLFTIFKTNILGS